jgi:hypothetical protein
MMAVVNSIAAGSSIPQIPGINKEIKVLSQRKRTALPMAKATGSKHQDFKEQLQAGFQARGPRELLPMPP